MKSLQTIYFVDDDPSARRGLTNLLTSANYNVEMFSSLGDFFQIKLIDTNACLVMDAWVSDFSGKDLHAVFAQKKINIPIILLSARDDKKSRDKAHTAHAAGFFRKPVDGPALLDAIAWALEKQSQSFTSQSS